MTSQPTTDPELHRQRMARLQIAMEARIAKAQGEKGLLIVHTGNGKGKSTAALGLLLRSLGHGMTSAVVQFIKGEQSTAETVLEAVASQCGARLQWDRVGEGFTWNTQDLARDQASAREGWDIVRRHLANPDLGFLLLDELNVVLRYGLLTLDDVLPDLAARPAHLHVAVTGRNAPAELIEMADLVTEMKELKHPFKAGIKAQAGIEF
jgi:cob(I)alamin adenosyltransferase